jgi:hypothetical protein
MFNTLATTNEVVTMSSLEMVDFINQTREENEPEIRHDNFMKKVGKVLGEPAQNFLATDFYTNGIGSRISRQIYNFPRREAILMAMSYSYKLQAKVFDTLFQLEQVTQAEITLDCYLSVAKLLSIPSHLARNEALNQVRINTGVDLTV